MPPRLLFFFLFLPLDLNVFSVVLVSVLSFLVGSLTDSPSVLALFSDSLGKKFSKPLGILANHSASAGAYSCMENGC